MNHPVLALAWHSWRLSRRWYLIVMLITIGLSFTLFNAVPADVKRFMPENVTYQQMAAIPVFLLTYVLAGLAALLAITMGNRNGFPFSYEFRMPVSTFTLTAVPMLVISVLSASLHALPLGLYRLLYDIPFPILPAVILLCGNVFILLGASWCASGNNSRALAITGGFVMITMLFAWIQPINTDHTSRSAASPNLFDARILTLSGGEYLFMGLMMVVVLGLTMQNISARRGGETSGRPPGKATTGTGWRQSTLAAFMEDGIGAADARFRRLALPCPTSAPWAAECWVEFRRYAKPILVLSLVVALLAPLLYLFGVAFQMRGVREMAAMTPLGLYFIGIGLSLFNRRMAHGGYMNAFERARPMSTVQLAGIQILMTGLAIALGIALIKFSLLLSEPLIADMSMRDSMLALGSLVVPIEDPSVLEAFCHQVMELVVFFMIICLFSCLHSSSLFWGRSFLIGVLIFLGYCLTFIFRLQAQHTELQTIINHMWAISGFILMLTLLVLFRLFRLGLIAWKGLLVMFSVWLLYLLCSFIALEALGYDFTLMAPELRMFNFSLLILPLTIAATTLWCYDRLRHS